MANKNTIGSVARAAGVSVETIRYYQRIGLLALPLKKAGGFRYYGDETAARVRFIKQAQVFGMSLIEIQRLLQLSSRSCAEARAMMAAKLQLVETQLDGLNKLRDCLTGLISECDRPHGEDCPILDQLTGKSPACC
jgi:MerR family mercuric resistance operon transcriptional regulator